MMAPKMWGEMETGSRHYEDPEGGSLRAEIDSHLHDLAGPHVGTTTDQKHPRMVSFPEAIE